MYVCMYMYIYSVLLLNICCLFMNMYLVGEIIVTCSYL